ncbi:MAG: hypothetical protein ACYDHH_26295 [Solirubrobacteraceae bacterium]
MGLTRRRALTGFAFLGIPVFPIPGLTGHALSLGGVSRTNTGGAVIAASIQGGRTGSSRLAVTRLLPDGTVDLAYGTRGITTASVGAAARATALAIDPVTGASGVGVLGRSGASLVVALDGRGNRVRSFGHGGVLTLPAALNGGPVAIAWRPGLLAVAAGREFFDGLTRRSQPCAGCQLGLIDPSSGRYRPGGSFSAGSGGAAPGSCSISGTTTVVFAASDQALLGVSVNRRPASESVSSVIGARQVLVAGSPAAVCVAADLGGSTEIGPYSEFERFHSANARGPGGRVVALTALGGGACAALIYPRGGHHAVVVQSSATGRAVRTDALPAFVQPLGLSRCNQHLLVIGDRLTNGTRQGLVAAVPVREGPHAAGAAAAAAASASAAVPTPAAAAAAAASASAAVPTLTAATCPPA